MQQIQATFGKECLPLNLPAARGTQGRRLFLQPGRAQADFSSVEAAHRALVEQVVEVDADFVERYLNEGDVDPHELHAPLEQALREGHLIPICFVSARNGAGVAELLDVMEALLPNPTEGNPPQFLKGEGADAKPLHAVPDPAQHVIAHVFKVTVDPYVGKMGVFRIHQGTVTRDSQLYIGDGRKPFKVGHLFMLQGKEHVEVSRGLPGDICAVAKVDEMHFDAVLHDAAEDDHLHLLPLDFPVPVHGLAIEPKRRGDEQRMWEILQKLVDEDPCLKVEHVIATNETVVYGLGELHLRTLLERMSEVYKCEVNTRPPRIAYRETITAKAEGHHRHKKQSGGAGQFGEVFLRIEPLARGAGFEFVDQVKGGTIPGQYIPAVEKGIRQVLDSGVIAGYPVKDVRVIVYDGKFHTRRLEGHRVRDRRPQGLHRRGEEGEPDRARADRQGRDHRARTQHGRHHRRPVGQTRPGERHARADRRRHHGQRPGAAVRAERLPGAPERHDRRAGPLRAGTEPLRGGARLRCRPRWSGQYQARDDD